MWVWESLTYDQHLRLSKHKGWSHRCQKAQTHHARQQTCNSSSCTSCSNLDCKIGKWDPDAGLSTKSEVVDVWEPAAMCPWNWSGRSCSSVRHHRRHSGWLACAVLDCPTTLRLLSRSQLSWNDRRLDGTWQNGMEPDTWRQPSVHRLKPASQTARRDRLHQQSQICYHCSDQRQDRRRASCDRKHQRNRH